MAGIDRLRKWVLQTREDGLGPMGTNLNDLLEISDAIEEEFKEQEQAHAFAYSQVYDFANGIYGQLLNFDKMEEQQDAMAEHGWVKLPEDADGEPIHMGDLVTVPWKDKVYEVAGFSCTKQLCSGIRTIWIDVYSPEKQRNVPLCGADSCRHYHAFTVEDVLREFADRVCNSGHQWGLDAADTIAEYAKKFRLAGDE